MQLKVEHAERDMQAALGALERERQLTALSRSEQEASKRECAARLERIMRRTAQERGVEKRRKHAEESARLGRFTFQRIGAGGSDVWEDGEEVMALNAKWADLLGRQRELEALKKEQETPQDVAKKAKSDIIGSMHLNSVVARDNAGLPASAKVQKEYDVGRGQAAVSAVTQAQADIQAGQSSDVVMANLVEVLNRLHVRLLGQVDNRKKLQDVINRLDGIEGEQRNRRAEKQPPQD